MRKIKEVKTKVLKTKADLIKAIKHYKSVTKKEGSIIFFDTETTGLNIKYDLPFLLPWGYMSLDYKTAYIYCVDRDADSDLFTQTALVIERLAKQKGLCGHNIKYDIHMLDNIGVSLPDDLHYIDTMVLIRLAHDALTPENGGPPLGLKEYAVKYIDRSAKDNERIVKAERTSISKEYNRTLKDVLYKVDRKWTLKYIDEYFKDVLHSVDTLDENVRPAYLEWYCDIPEQIRNNMTSGRVESDDIPYNLLNRQQVTEYAMYDIVWTMEVYLQCIAAVEARQNMDALKREEEMIPALVRMEACGFQIDGEYVRQVTKDLAQYLKERRDALFNLVQETIGVGQHAKIKEILNNKYNLNVVATGKEDLNRIYDELKAKTPDAEVVQFIGLVQELRTLEKWYATYLLRFVRELDLGHTRIYTQINQVGTVSGRVTSDFQQFPKYGVDKADGTPLFHPRRMIVKSDGFKGIAYLDYSQVELRLQALYTILVGEPDLNLCRAYMPYQCLTADGIEFNYENPDHIKHAYDWKWYLKEDTAKEWEATDVHAATTHVAFPDLDTKSDEFKKLRGKVGKRVNFAKNYGAQFNKIKTMFPDYDDETIHRIDDAYYGAFPGVKKYHEYCYTIVDLQPYVPNLFGVKYYGLSGHKLINCLVQGSGAYLLKERIKEVDDYIQSNHLKSRLQMQIHDELSYEIYPGEEEHVYKFQEIMQKFEGSYVPIVADLEFTTTSWADKYETDRIE
jgi:DNA polymerase-1